jgi:hypothetical protein
MRFSLTALIRLIAFALLGTSAVAVWLSRELPSPPRFRSVTAPRYYGVNGSIFRPPLPENFLLDTRTGKLTEATIEGKGSLEYVSCSPWTDERGEFELVGRLTTRTGRGRFALCEGAELIRFSTSDAGARERVELDPVVSGRPCWLPRLPSRVIVPAGDGLLYVRNFGTDGGGADEPSHPVRWSCRPPGVGEPIISDPIWAAVPSLGERLLITLCERRSNASGVTYMRSKLWWIKLDETRTSIVEAGRLTVPAVGVGVGGGEGPGSVVADEDEEERMPNLAIGADKRVVLAYLSRHKGENGWRVMVAPVETDRALGRPVARLSESRQVRRDCAVVTPAFSPDGRWVYSFAREVTGGPVPERFSVSEALARDVADTPSVALSPKGPSKPF